MCPFFACVPTQAVLAVLLQGREGTALAAKPFVVSVWLY